MKPTPFISLPTNTSLVLDDPIKVMTQTQKNLSEITSFWKGAYQKIYPNYKLSKEDPFNQTSYILYSRNPHNKMVSSARLTIDSKIGLPDDDVYPKAINTYRKKCMKLLEFGRFVITEGGLTLLKQYYKSIYQLARAIQVDVIVMTMKDKDVALHRRLMGAYLLSSHLNTNNGGRYKMACVSWELNNTKEQFFQWAGFLADFNQGVVR